MCGVCNFIRTFIANFTRVYHNDGRFSKRMDVSVYTLCALLSAAFSDFILYKVFEVNRITAGANLLGIYLPAVLLVFIVAFFVLLAHTIAPICKQTVRDMQTPDGEDPSENPPPLNNQQAPTVVNEQPGPSSRVPQADPNICVNKPDKEPSTLTVKWLKRQITPGVPPVEETELQSSVSIDSLYENITFHH